MLYCLDPKFDKWVSARWVDPKIPDDLLKELKEFNEEIKKVDGRDHFDFPR